MSNDIAEMRNTVLEGRITVAISDAINVLSELKTLIGRPATSGAEQEQCMRSVEESLYNIQWRIQRLKEIGK